MSTAIFILNVHGFRSQTLAVIFAVQTLSIMMLDIAYGCLLLYYFLFIIGFLNTLVCGTNSLLFNALDYSSSYLPIVSRESEVLHIYRKQKKLKCGYIKLTFYGFVDPTPRSLALVKIFHFNYIDLFLALLFGAE